MKQKLIGILMILITFLLISLNVSSSLPCDCSLDEEISYKEDFSVSEVESEAYIPPDGKYSIIINTFKKTLTVYKESETIKTYSVAVGKPSTKSPVGEWAIIRKAKHWGGGFGTRWMGLNVPWGIYGIHGTNKPGSIGTAASHGCIRMNNRDVEELYDLIPVKTRVKIIGERKPINVNNPLKSGQTGLEVMQLQDNLKEYGFKPAYMDARYGPSTSEAVKELEAQFNLNIDGETDWNILYILNLPGK